MNDAISSIEYCDSVSDKFPDYLSDESNLFRGSADLIYFPTEESQIRAIVESSRRSGIPITVSGGGTGLAGGRIPHEGWIIATDKMRTVSDPGREAWRDPETNRGYEVALTVSSEHEALLTVPVSMTQKSIQSCVREKGWFYPPDTTETSSFIGGNVAANASGARSFKFGATRRWIQGLRVVLPGGQLLVLRRDDSLHAIRSGHINLMTDHAIRVPLPGYRLPSVTKNVAGPVVTGESDALDLFIGTDGIFGIVTEVTLKLAPPPRDIASVLAFCGSSDQALELIETCQRQRREEQLPVPLSVEFLGQKATEIMKSKDGRIQSNVSSIVMIEQDAYRPDELLSALEYWAAEFDRLGVEDTYFAQTNAEIEHHKFLRHCVPEHVITLTRANKQALITTDYAVPEEKLRPCFHYLLEVGDDFERFQNGSQSDDGEPAYVFWAHAGDSHFHLSLIPRCEREAAYGKSLLLKIAEKVLEMGGTIAAEHGLGKKRLGGKPALGLQYGQQGVDEIRRMKAVLDPDMLLNPGNLVG